MDDSILAMIILLGIIVSFAIPIIPMGITAILGSIAMALAGLMKFSDVFSGFANDIVMMVAGMIIVGNAFNETGLASALGQKVLCVKFVQKSERIFLTVVLTVVAILHCFLTNTAIVAIFLPLVASVAQASKGVITKKNTFMAIGIMSVVSGNITLISSTPQLAAQAILSRTVGCSPIKFFDMTWGAIPMIILGILYFCTVGYDLSKKVFDFPEVKDDIPREKISINKTKMVICGLVFIGCMVCFVSGVFTPGIVSILAASILIITNCITFPRAMQTMDWNTLLIIAGALGFGVALDKSGTVELVAQHIMQLSGGGSANPYLIFAILVISASLLSTTMSNTAVAVIMTPMAIVMAQSIGSNPTTFVFGVIFGCNYDFLTPIGTPPLTMTLSGGYRFLDYTKIGGIFNVIAIVSTIIILPLIYGF